MKPIRTLSFERASRISDSHKAVHKYLGLIYDKVDSNPDTGNIGDIVIYNTPTAGGYIGAVYTASGWKGFGAIEA